MLAVNTVPNNLQATYMCLHNCVKTWIYTERINCFGLQANSKTHFQLRLQVASKPEHLFTRNFEYNLYSTMP